MSDTDCESDCEVSEQLAQKKYEEVFGDLERIWIQNPPVNKTPEEIKEGKRRERDEKKRIKEDELSNQKKIKQYEKDRKRREQDEEKKRILDRKNTKIQKPGEGILGDIPVHIPSPKVSKRPPIGKRLKYDVWHKYIGTPIFQHKCLCCKMRDIKRDEFECGHVVSHACGGPTTIPNLRPICMLCNRSMGTENMIDFVIRNRYFIG